MPHGEFYRIYRVISGEKPHSFRGLDLHSACRLIISRLAARNELFQSVMLGRSLVFYRPEASNAMETERFEKAYKALICLQARRLKHIAAARVAALSEARRLLRESMRLGEQLSRCNTEAIPALEKEIKACTDSHMICYVINEAMTLLERLRKIRSCKERMQRLVDSHDSFTDIICYHNDMKTCISEAREFGIKSPLIVQAQSHLEDIKERVDALIDLRDAMKVQDDEILAKCMKTVAQLSSKYGTYCSSEVTHASQIFNEVRCQMDQLDEALGIIESIQKTVNKNNSESCIDSVVRDQPDLNSRLDKLLSQKPGSDAGIAMMNIFQSILAIRTSWIRKEWSAVAIRMKQLHKECDAGVVQELTKASPQNRARVKAWQSASLREVDLIVVEMDVHYFLPKIMSVWIDTDGKASGYSVDKEEVELQRLQSTIDEIKSVGWLGSNLMALFPLFDTALDLKKAHALDEPEVILGITEGEVTTRARLKRRNDLVAVFNSEELMEDFSVITVLDKPEKKGNRRTSIHFGQIPATEAPLAEDGAAASRRHTMIDSMKGRPMSAIAEGSPGTESPHSTSRKSPGGLTGMFETIVEPVAKEESAKHGRLPLPPPPRRSSVGPDSQMGSPPPPPPPPPCHNSGLGSVPPPPPPPPPQQQAKIPPSRGVQGLPPPPPTPPPLKTTPTLPPPPPRPPVSEKTPAKISLQEARVPDASGKKAPSAPKTRLQAYPPIASDLLTHRKTLTEIDDIVSSLTGKFREAAEVIKNDIARTRSIALERYAQMLLTEAIQFGTIQGSGGKLRLDRGSVIGLSKTMKEVEDSLREKTYVDPLTQPIIEMSKSLIFLRKAILESSFEAIVKMQGKGQLDVSEPTDVPMSRVQAIFFQMAKAETTVIVTEASNEWFSRKLSSVLQVGAIRGDVGKVKSSEIGFKEIEDVIAMILTSRAARGSQAAISDSLQ